MAENYHHLLKEQVSGYQGDIGEVFEIPNFFRMLTDLLSREVDAIDRKNICSALGYLVAPKDAIPEEIYADAGFVDDLFICAWALDLIRQKHGMSVMEDLWRGEKDKFEAILDSALEKSGNLIDGKNLRKTIFEYVGLQTTFQNK